MKETIKTPISAQEVPVSDMPKTSDSSIQKDVPLTPESSSKLGGDQNNNELVKNNKENVNENKDSKENSNEVEYTPESYQSENSAIDQKVAEQNLKIESIQQKQQELMNKLENIRASLGLQKSTEYPVSFDFLIKEINKAIEEKKELEQRRIELRIRFEQFLLIERRRRTEELLEKLILLIVSLSPEERTSSKIQSVIEKFFFMTNLSGGNQVVFSRILELVMNNMTNQSALEELLLEDPEIFETFEQESIAESNSNPEYKKNKEEKFATEEGVDASEIKNSEEDLSSIDTQTGESASENRELPPIGYEGKNFQESGDLTNHIESQNEANPVSTSSPEKLDTSAEVDTSSTPRYDPKTQSN